MLNKGPGTQGLIKVLGRATSSNVQKVLWLLDEIGQDYVREDYGGEHGRTHEAAYLLLNPNATVPTLVHGDFTLWESNAICRYLARTFGAAKLYPADPRQRADCERWMDWQLAGLGAAMPPLYLQLVRTPAEMRDPAIVKTSRSRSNALFGVLDAVLRDRAFLCGDDFTIADLALGPWTHRWFALGLADIDCSALRAWYARLQEREPYRRHIMIPLS